MGAHESPSRVEAGGSKVVCLKSYNVQKWEIEFTLGLNAAKICITSKKVQIKVVRN